MTMGYRIRGQAAASSAMGTGGGTAMGMQQRLIRRPRAPLRMGALSAWCCWQQRTRMRPFWQLRCLKIGPGKVLTQPPLMALQRHQKATRGEEALLSPHKGLFCMPSGPASSQEGCLPGAAGSTWCPGASADTVDNPQLCLEGCKNPRETINSCSFEEILACVHGHA